MPLASSASLAPHFTAGELGADDATASGAVVGNLRVVAAYLEQVRGILGVPLEVTSGYRSPAHNLEVGGDPNSDHPRGLAADVVPLGVSQFQVYSALKRAREAGVIGPWDQLIFYPVEGHVHIGLGERRRGEVRIKLAEGSLATLTDGLTEKLRGYVPPAVASLLGLLLFALFLLILIPGLP